MCKRLEPSVSGRYIHNKKNGENYYTVQELLSKNNCLSCTERYTCRILEILENKYPKGGLYTDNPK